MQVVSRAKTPLTIERLKDLQDRSLVVEAPRWSDEEIRYMAELCWAQQTEDKKLIKYDTGHIVLFVESTDDTKKRVLNQFKRLAKLHPNKNLRLTRMLVGRLEAMLDDIKGLIPDTRKRFSLHIVYQKKIVGSSTVGGRHLHQHLESDEYPWLVIENIFGEGSEIVGQIQCNSANQKLPVSGTIKRVMPGERHILFQADKQNYHRAPKYRFPNQDQRMFMVAWMSDDWIEEHDFVMMLAAGKLPENYGSMIEIVESDLNPTNN